MLLVNQLESGFLFFANITQTLPLPTDAHSVASDASLYQILYNRIATCPFNLIASIIFLCAILHTFVAAKFSAYSHTISPISPSARAKKVLFQ